MAKKREIWEPPQSAIETAGGQVWEMRDFGPEQAAQLLERVHPNQRRLRERHVESIARAMRAGKFAFTSDTVKLDADGMLVDGMHRLSAVVRSGVQLGSVLLARLTQPDAAKYLDTVVKPRTMRDLRRFTGAEECNPAIVAAIVLEFCDFREADTYLLTKPEKHELVDQLEFGGASGDEAVDVLRQLYAAGRTTSLKSGPLAGALRGLRHDRERATRFFLAAFNNRHEVDGVPSAAARLLADWLLRDYRTRTTRMGGHGGGATSSEGAEKAIKAYKMHVAGKTAAKLQRSRGGARVFDVSAPPARKGGS